MGLDFHSFSLASHWKQATQEGAWPWGSAAVRGWRQFLDWDSAKNNQPPIPPTALMGGSQWHILASTTGLDSYLNRSCRWQDSYAFQGHAVLLVMAKKPGHFREFKQGAFKRGVMADSQWWPLRVRTQQALLYVGTSKTRTLELPGIPNKLLTLWYWALNTVLFSLAWVPRKQTPIIWGDLCTLKGISHVALITAGPPPWPSLRTESLTKKHSPGTRNY